MSLIIPLENTPFYPVSSPLPRPSRVGGEVGLIIEGEGELTLTFHNLYLVRELQTAAGRHGAQERCHIGRTAEAVGERLVTLTVVNLQEND